MAPGTGPTTWRRYPCTRLSRRSSGRRASLWAARAPESREQPVQVTQPLFRPVKFDDRGDGGVERQSAAIALHYLRVSVAPGTGRVPGKRIHARSWPWNPGRSDTCSLHGHPVACLPLPAYSNGEERCRRPRVSPSPARSFQHCEGHVPGIVVIALVYPLIVSRDAGQWYQGQKRDEHRHAACSTILS
jgi:hypothetical protein